MGLPKFPKPPPFPKPPRLSDLLNTGNPVKEIIEDTRQLIRGGKDEIRALADALRLEGRPSRLAEPLSEPVVPAKVADVVHVTPAKVATVTDAETLQYQKESLLDELAVLERHLADGGKIFGASCDCVSKHSRLIKRLSTESIPIAARQDKGTKIYSELAGWAAEMQAIGTKAAVDSGQFTSRYPVESGKASLFRKAIEGGKDCVTCDPKKPLPTVREFLKQQQGKKP